MPETRHSRRKTQLQGTGVQVSLASRPGGDQNGTCRFLDGMCGMAQARPGARRPREPEGSDMADLMRRGSLGAPTREVIVREMAAREMAAPAAPSASAFASCCCCCR